MSSSRSSSHFEISVGRLLPYHARELSRAGNFLLRMLQGTCQRLQQIQTSSNKDSKISFRTCVFWAVANGGRQWCPPPTPFKIYAPSLHVFPPSCCIHPILYLKNVAPLWGWYPCCEILATGLCVLLGEHIYVQPLGELEAVWPVSRLEDASS